MIITGKEMKEIEGLIPEHKEALIAYGADMYRRGLFAVAAYLCIGMGCSLVIHGSVGLYKTWKPKKNKEIES